MSLGKKWVVSLCCLAAAMAVTVSAAWTALPEGQGEQGEVQGDISVVKGNQGEGRVYRILVTNFGKNQLQQASRGGRDGQGLSSQQDQDALQVRIILDPRFTLTESERTRLTEQKITCLEREDGTTVVIFPLVAGQGQESIQLLVEARENFVGGNHIPVIQEGSGVISGGALLLSYQIPRVNVPVRFHVNSVYEEVRVGERVPLETEEGLVEKRMYQPQEDIFCGQEATGRFQYLWLDQQGAEIGTSNQLGKLLLAEDTVFYLQVSFIPWENGEGLSEEAGTPVGTVSRQGCYAVSVIP